MKKGLIIEFYMNFFFITDMTMNLRSRNNSKQRGSENSVKECKYCFQTFKNEKSLVLHMKAIHENPKFRCYLCNQVFISKSKLTNHNQQFHDTQKEPKCNFCGKYFLTTEDLKEHSSEHKDKSKKLKCELCGISFILKQKLDKHVKEVHEKISQRLQCNQCTKTFKDQNLLDNHMKVTHKMAKIYQCDYCDKTFELAEALRKHIAVFHSYFSTLYGAHKRTKTKSHKCHFCSRSFGWYESFKEHYKNDHVSENDSNNSTSIVEPVCNDQICKSSQSDQHLTYMNQSNFNTKPSFDNPDVQVKVKARLNELGFMFSPTDPDTKADGNCFIYGLMDQLR